MGVTAAMLLAIAPIAMPLINAGTETHVQAEVTNQYQNNSIDFNLDPDSLGKLGFHLNVDGQDKVVYSRQIVFAKNEGDVDVQEAPLLDGYVANPSTVSFQRTATGYRLLQIPTYTKSNSDLAAQNATIKTFYEIITVRNNDANYCPLVAFSTTDGKIYDLTNRALANNTDWYSDQIKTYDGARYFRVATNEWVKETYFHGGRSGGNIGPQ